MNEKYYRVYFFFGLPCGFRAKGAFSTIICGIETDSYLDVGQMSDYKKFMYHECPEKTFHLVTLIDELRNEYPLKCELTRKVT